MRKRVTAKVERSNGTVWRARSGRGLVFGVDRLAVPDERWPTIAVDCDDGEEVEFCELHGDDAALCRAFEARQP